MFWPKIGNSISDRLFRNSVIAENQCLYIMALDCCQAMQIGVIDSNPANRQFLNELQQINICTQFQTLITMANTKLYL